MAVSCGSGPAGMFLTTCTPPAHELQRQGGLFSRALEIFDYGVLCLLLALSFLSSNRASTGWERLPQDLAACGLQILTNTVQWICTPREEKTMRTICGWFRMCACRRLQ